jgi:hypothetical protein
MATTNGDYIWNTWTSTSAGTEDSLTDVWSNWSATKSMALYERSTSDSTTVSSTDCYTSLYKTAGQIWYNWTNHHEHNAKKLTIHSDYGESGYTKVWSTWVTPERFKFTIHSDYGEGKVQKSIREQIAEAKRLERKVLSTEILRARRTQSQIETEWNNLRMEERDRERKEAELTAQDLLLDIIGKDALQRYKETDRLFVKGQKFDYVLSKGRGVHRIEKDKVVDFIEKKKAVGHFVCVHPKQSYNFPETDNVITLKLWIENDEDRFLRIGNLHKGTEEIANFDKVVNG